VVCGKELSLRGVPIMIRDPQAPIRIGNKVVLCSRPLANVLYLAHPCVMAAVGPKAIIEVGDDVGMSGATLIATNRIVIGDHVIIDAEALLVDSDFHPLDPVQRALHSTAGARSGPITVGRHVFIGARAIILKGVSIGDGAVIGAGAVVTKDVAAGDIVAGNPASVVGSVLTEKKADR
jgi:acetyltransferase-like isoleucine patch superfamily enzyme